MRLPHLHNATPPADPDHVEHGCGFMREMLSGIADGSLRGVLRWYAEHHVAGCPHCSAALNGLQELRTRLRQFGLPSLPIEEAAGTTAEELPSLQHLSAERRAAVAAAWEKFADDGPEA